MKFLHTLTLLILVSIQAIGQCSTNTNSLPFYSLLVGQETVPMSTIVEISGLTYNDITGEFFVVSDDGKLARRSTSGNWTDIDIPDFSGNACNTSEFSDIEGITYMNQTSTDTHRYAIAEERERVITFVNISNNQTSIDYPDNSYLSFDDISFIAPDCGDNSGIEGIAYDVNSNSMYFGIQRDDPKIYKFDVPNNINGQSIYPEELVNLDDLGLNIFGLSALEVFENGNLLVLAAIDGTAPSDIDLHRIMLEFDPCGNLLSQQEIEPIIPNSSTQLEGIAMTGSEISFIGEQGIFYTLERESSSTTGDECTTTTNDVATYTNLIGQEQIPTSLIDEVSGLTYNEVTEEFLVVSDDGSLGKSSTSGVWTKIDFNDFSGNACNNSQFSDTESITYIEQVSADTHRYAIAEERERFITFVDIANNQTDIDFPEYSFLRFNGISVTAPDCGNNEGIEGLAYDAAINTMYFGMQRNDAKIYKFEVPSNIVGQSISVTEVVNLDILGLNIYGISGMDVFDNGNIVVLATLQGNGNDGLFDRIILEFDPCGELVSQMEVEPTIPSSIELEGIVVVDNKICLTGELGVLYHLGQEAIATPTCADIRINFAGSIVQTGDIVNVSGVTTRNSGDMTAGTYSVSAYLTTNLSITFSDIFVADIITVNNHAANALQNFAFSFDVTSLNLPAGTYYVGYIIDRIDELSECDEMNNTGILTTGTITIGDTSECLTTKTINDNPIPSKHYQTEESLFSAGKVTSNSAITFDTGNFISLEPGFEVTMNAEFEAMIDGCN